MATGASLTNPFVHDVARLEELDGVDVAVRHVVAQHLAVHHPDETLATFLGVQLGESHLGLEVLCLCSHNAVLLLLVGGEGREGKGAGPRPMGVGAIVSCRKWKHQVTFPAQIGGSHTNE